MQRWRRQEECLLSRNEPMPPLRPVLIRPGLVSVVSVFVTMSALLVPALSGPRNGEIIHLPIHLPAWKPFIMRPETSINYSDGRKSEERETFERQIHLDLIGKQVCSRLLSRFPLRWSWRDNGAKKRRWTKKNEGEKETKVRRTDGREDDGNVQDEKNKKTKGTNK